MGAKNRSAPISVISEVTTEAKNTANADIPTAVNTSKSITK